MTVRWVTPAVSETSCSVRWFNASLLIIGQIGFVVLHDGQIRMKILAPAVPILRSGPLRGRVLALPPPVDARVARKARTRTTLAKTRRPRVAVAQSSNSSRSRSTRKKKTVPPKTKQTKKKTKAERKSGVTVTRTRSGGFAVRSFGPDAPDLRSVIPGMLKTGVVAARGGAVVGGENACTCGHATEEHGRDSEHPGSTGCAECDCIAYEDAASASSDRG